MKKAYKVAAIVAAMAVAASMAFAGCGNSSSSSSGSTDNKGATASSGENGETGETVTAGRNGDVWVTENGNEIDISKKVELMVYTFAGSSPNDIDMINDAASKITEEQLNCTVDVQVMTDWSTRYNLALSSGEAIDLIWTAQWYSYQPYAFDGAWLDITELAQEVTPTMYNMIGADEWNSNKIGGSNYGIPSLNKANNQWGVAWREDLRKEMGCSEIVDVATMEEYAAAILENHPEMIPYCDSSSGGMFHSLSEQSHTFIGLGNPQFSYGVGVDPETDEIYQWDTTDWFRDYVVQQREWVMNGYVQPDVASTTDTYYNGITTGKYAGGLAVTLSGMPSLNDAAEQLGWEIGYLNYGTMYQWTYYDSATSMAMALPASCPNPERALLFAEQVLTNADLFRIYDMGIEGTHYEINDDGYYVSLNDPTNPGYLQGGAGLTSLLFNPEAKVYAANYQYVLDYLEENIEPYLIVNKFQNFPEDYSSYSDLQSANYDISQQYKWPVIRGAVEDPEAALDDALARQDAAGRQEMIEHVREQYAAYIASME